MKKKWKPKVEYRNPSLLIPYPNNAKVHSDVQIRKIADAIHEFGFTQPILIDSEGIIIAGHGRREAAILLKLQDVPVVVADHLTPAQVKAARLADNRIAEAPWNPELLKIEFEELILENYEVELTGFEMPEIEQIKLNESLPDVERNSVDKNESAPVEKPEEKSEEEIEHVPDVPAEAKTKLGDVYAMGEHRLLCGDATDPIQLQRLLSGNKPQLIFTDPPYGVSYEQGKFTGIEAKKKFAPIANDEKRGDDLRAFVRDVFKNIFDVCDVANIYAWSPPLIEGAEILAALMEAGWHIQSQLIWNKKRLILGRADYQWQHEICWYGYKGKNHYWCGDRNQTSVWEQKRDTNYDHPTQKPVELSERAINNSSETGQIVLDVFCGSGSTLIGCEKTNRICYAMELSPHYCDVIVARWEQFTGKKATLLTQPSA